MRYIRWAVFVVVLCAAWCALGEDTPPWRVEVGASLIQASGNTSALTAGGHGSVQYVGARYRASLDGGYLRVQGAQGIANEKATADLAVERISAPLVAPYLQASYRRDVLSGIAGQYGLEAGASLRIIDEESRWFFVGISVSGAQERQPAVPDGTNRFWGSTLRVRQRWPLTSTLFASSKTALFWNAHVGGDWRVENIAALEVRLTRLLALEMRHEANYRRLPVDHKRPFDQLSLVSLVIAFPAKN